MSEIDLLRKLLDWDMYDVIPFQLHEDEAKLCMKALYLVCLTKCSENEIKEVLEYLKDGK